MELYLFIVVVLFALAISDLIVGVSNDAVNFLNSAIGSRVAKRRTIMIIASIGMLLGVTFSTGMMEVARKGIFAPQYFVVTELLVIYLAVMITDIILLDMYNTFGLPTSTTVSIVFELLGAAVAVSILKILGTDGQTMADLVNYINTAKALAIISGILLSIVVAFSVGAIIQWLARLLFSFDYEKYIKWFGGLYGGISLSSITYFILIKGAKGASWLTPEMVDWIKHHTWWILGGSFVLWSLLLYLAMWLFRLNVLRFIVLVGTGSLAMAFAANDLVNFIGVPLAGFHSYLIAAANPIDPLNTSMAALAGSVKTDTWMLLIAGAVMVVTLWLSRKARTVTKTEIGLSRQGEGDERFDALGISRPFVRGALGLSGFFEKMTPPAVLEGIRKRFSPRKEDDVENKGRPAFDLVRASVNLTVASALISLATSFKLPLSTTYVTFMVAMGTSLSDRAWGRESAVYRISGVLTVIGGWFFTAFMAFSVSFIFALLIKKFGIFAIVILLLLAVYFVINTHRVHKRREDDVATAEEDIEADDIVGRMSKKCSRYFAKVNTVLNNSIFGLFEQDRKKLKEARESARSLKKAGRSLVSNVFSNIQDMQSHDISPRIVTALSGVGRHLSDLAEMCYLHVVNEHKSLSREQVSEIKKVQSTLEDYIKRGVAFMQADDRNGISKTVTEGEKLIEPLLAYHKGQIKRIKKGESKTRQSMLYFGILSHSEEIAEEFIQLLKGYNETFHSDK